MNATMLTALVGMLLQPPPPGIPPVMADPPNICAGLGDETSALDLLPSYRDSLTREASRLLSMTPVALDEGFMPGWAFTVEQGRCRGLDLTVIFGNELTEETILHESLHAIDAAHGFRLSAQLPASVLADHVLFERYWETPWTLEAEPLNAWEAFATLGMLGPENVPPEFLPLFAEVFAQ